VYLGSVTVREKVSIDLLELVYGETTRRAVLQKTFVPFLDLGICKK